MKEKIDEIYRLWKESSEKTVEDMLKEAYKAGMEHKEDVYTYEIESDQYNSISIYKNGITISYFGHELSISQAERLAKLYCDMLNGKD